MKLSRDHVDPMGWDIHWFDDDWVILKDDEGDCYFSFNCERECNLSEPDDMGEVYLHVFELDVGSNPKEYDFSAYLCKHTPKQPPEGLIMLYQLMTTKL